MGYTPVSDCPYVASVRSTGLEKLQRPADEEKTSQTRKKEEKCLTKAAARAPASFLILLF